MNISAKQTCYARGLSSRGELVHQAVWKNSIASLERLLEEGCSIDFQDEESGWSGLHKALYWGRLRAAALLLEAGAALQHLDHEGRSPLDLLSTDLVPFLRFAAAGEVYSWGNGANYQLGSGAVGLQETPVRLENLHSMSVKAVAAAKFHSAAITEDGQLFTWGFGRGGRLGHGHFHIHSGESAVILPQQVPFFARRQVLKIATAKHHTAAITTTGELFTWGSNRDGRLGYQAADTQPTPRKISTFNRQRIVDVAAANRHTVSLLDDGSVFSWGSNLQGQLGYGTSDSASNATPRIVEAMKGKLITAVAVAKRHTVVLTSEGSVYTWGHRLVTPRRVILAGSRDVARSSSVATGYSKGWEVVFHKGQGEVSRPVAHLIAAGAAHSSAVTSDGVVLTWRSMDPSLRPQEVGGLLAGKEVTAVSAGKYRTAVVTSTGDVYMWEGWSKATEAILSKRVMSTLGTSPQEDLPPEWEVSKAVKQRKSGTSLAFQLITPQRVEGLKRVTGIAVGEKHSLALQSWCQATAEFETIPAVPAPVSPLSPHGSAFLEEAEGPPSLKPRREKQGIHSDEYWAELDAAQSAFRNPFEPPEQHESPDKESSLKGVDTLQRLCERCVSTHLVEPRTALQVLEFADAAGSSALQQHCMGVVLSNLDLIILESRAQFHQLIPHILEDLQERFCRRFSRPTANLTSAGQDADSNTPSPLLDRIPSSSGASQGIEDRPFKNPQEEAEAHERAKQERAIRKKLQQIDALEERAELEALNAQQQAKVSLRPILLSALQALQKGRALKAVKRILAAAMQSSSAPSSGMMGKKSSPSQSQSSKKGRAETRGQEKGSSSELSSSVNAGPPGASLDSLTSQRSSQGNEAILDTNSTRSEPRSEPADPVRRVSGFAEAPKDAIAQNQTADSFKTPPPKAHKGGLQPEKSETHSVGSRTPGGKKPSKRKGGLSMFLTGQLELPAQEPEPKATTPASIPPKAPLTWAKSTPKSGITTSLKEIQDQESAAEASQGWATKAATPRSHLLSQPSEDSTVSTGKAINSTGKTGNKGPGNQTSRSGEDTRSAASNGITIALDDLVKKKSKPISVARPVAEQRKGPAWGPPPQGASPNAHHTKLQDIQAEQEQRRESSSRSWGASGASPGSQKSSLLGGPLTWRPPGQTSILGTSPSLSFPAGTSPSNRRTHVPASQPQSKWYIKEEPEIVPLRCIQTAEFALKELSELYGAQGSAVSQSNEKQQQSSTTSDGSRPQPSASGKKSSRPRPRRSNPRRSNRGQMATPVAPKMSQ